jgi:hypothetical protein
VSSAPRFAPSTLNWTPTTRSPSDATAEAETMPPTTVPADGAAMPTAGAVVSHVAVETLTWVLADVLPTPSNASTATVYA